MSDLAFIFFGSWVAGFVVARFGVDRLVGRAISAGRAEILRLARQRGVIL